VALIKPRAGKRILLLAVVAALSATALLAIGILLLGDFGEREGRILTTTALLAAYGLLALPAGFLFDQRRLRGLAATVLDLTATGFAFAVAAVWMSSPPDELGNTLATITAFAVACTQTAALAVRRRVQDPKAVRRLFVASTALALFLAAMFAAAIWGEIESSVYFRILAAFAVLDVLMVALQPILALTRPVGAAYRLRVFVEPEDVIETTVEAPDLASAAAKAIRTIERGGREITGLELAKKHGAG
jgi:MFS family permease